MLYLHHEFFVNRLHTTVLQPQTLIKQSAPSHPLRALLIPPTHSPSPRVHQDTGSPTRRSHHTSLATTAHRKCSNRWRPRSIPKSLEEPRSGTRRGFGAGQGTRRRSRRVERREGRDEIPAGESGREPVLYRFARGGRGEGRPELAGPKGGLQLLQDAGKWPRRAFPAICKEMISML